ncbi:MAG: tetratricopeptide repeat protein [Planctomycetota bacterium]
MSRPALSFLRQQEVFWRAVELRGAERSAYLEEVGQESVDLRAEVEALIAYHEAEVSGLDRPPVTATLVGASPTLSTGTMLGSYRVERFLAEGGMGAVYLAEQSSPRRTVALKVLKPGAMTPSLMHRFVLEAEVLGRLHHPGIAQIYDAGRSADQCYFALEFVAGCDLIRHAEDRALSDRERLALIARVADAVQHAHQRGVIHRDLKPSNVLVDETGQPKILDFGVARVADRDGILRSFATVAGQVVGTLPYMSPEQVSGDPYEVDVRTDVYGLGALLYELLTGKRPLDLEGRSLTDAFRAIEQEAPLPLGSLRPDLDQDVATIVHHALNKERARRYESAAAFAADVRRYLQSQPIAARPLTLRYQISRFARRNRGFVASLLTVAAVVVAAGVAVGFFAWNEHRANESSERLLAYLFDHVLTVPDPWRGGERDVALADVLGHAEESVDRFFPNAPGERARVLEAVATTLQHLGRLEEAERVFARAATAAEGAFGRLDEKTLAIRNARVVTLQSLGRNAIAHAEAQALFDDARACLGPDAVLTLNALNNLALCTKELGRHAQALELYRDCVARKTARFGAESDDTLATRGNLAHLLQQMGRPREAVPELRAVLAGYERLYGRAHPDTLISMDILGTTLQSVGELEEAERLIREAHNGSLEVMGENHPDTLATEYHLAQVLAARQSFEEAIGHFERVRTELVATLGEANPRTIQVAVQQGGAFLEAGRLDEAEPLIVDAVMQSDGPAFARLALRASVLFHRARLAARRDHPEAREWFDRTLTLARELFDAESPHTALVLAEYGEWLVGRGETEAARGFLRDSPAILENAYGADDRRTRRARAAAERAERVE